jgi:hypothetical protein
VNGRGGKKKPGFKYNRGFKKSKYNSDDLCNLQELFVGRPFITMAFDNMQV